MDEAKHDGQGGDEIARQSQLARPMLWLMALSTLANATCAGLLIYILLAGLPVEVRNIVSVDAGYHSGVKIDDRKPLRVQIER